MQKLKVKGDVEGRKRKKCGMNWRQGKVFFKRAAPQAKSQNLT
jgi:hypothetical protein